MHVREGRKEKEKERMHQDNIERKVSMSRQEKVQELMRMKERKPEKRAKKATEIFSCFKRGRVHDARADGSRTRLQSVFIQT